MASSSYGESTGNVESTDIQLRSSAVVVAVLLSSLLRSGGKVESSVSKSARHRSGNVQGIVVWKSGRHKTEKLKKCASKLRSAEK